MEEESELSRKAKQKAKNKVKKLLLSALPTIIGILIVVVIAAGVLSIFTTMMDKMAELASNVKVTVSNFWKWFTDDYWIKLDKEIEFTGIDEATRSRSN